MTNALRTLLDNTRLAAGRRRHRHQPVQHGLEAGDAPEMWNVTTPTGSQPCIEGAVDAGSDIFLTNTFGGNASRLKLHNAQDRVHELNAVGAEIGREVADALDRTVIVAGSVGPTGEIMDPCGTLTHALAVEMFHDKPKA